MKDEGESERVVSFVDVCNQLQTETVKIMTQENASMHKVSFEYGKLIKWIHKQGSREAKNELDRRSSE